MPYVDPAVRADLEPLIAELGERISSEPIGVVNYVVTRLVFGWLREPLSYAGVNVAVGVLECAKLELYRRLAAPYEDRKRAENGDVY